MSAREAPEESRRKPLLTVIFWVGVGLAPLAALLLLFGQGNGPLRIAAVLAVLAVVLIGLSITLRGSADGIQLEMEETLLEELDELRGELRTDIATAARATHKAFGEKLELVQGNVEALRGQLDAVRASVDAPRAVAAAPTTTAAGAAVTGAAVGGAAVAGAAVGGASVGGAAVGVTRPASRSQHGAPAQGGWAPAEAAPAGRIRGDAGPRSRDDGFRGDGPQGDGPRRATGPAPYRAADHGGAGHHQVPPATGYDRGGYPDDDRAGSGRAYGRTGADPDTSPGQYGRSGGQPWSAGDRPQHGAPTGIPGGIPGPHLGAGVVRHTETVQVTTRQTIVGAHSDDPRSGGGYGAGGYGAGQGGTYGGGTYGGGYSPGMYGGGGRDGGYGDDGYHGGGRNGYADTGGGTYGGARDDDPARGGGTYGGARDDDPARGGGTYGGARDDAPGRGGGTYGGADRSGGSHGGGGRSAGTYGGGAGPDGNTYGGGRSAGTYGGGAGPDGNSYGSYAGDGGRDHDEHAGDRDDRGRRAGRGGRSEEPDDGPGDDRRFGIAGWRARFVDSDPEPGQETGDPADDSYWADLRAGDRWTSVRNDERGQEVRMGERRASMRTDETGTELRVEDRWAAVRREDPGRDDDRRSDRRRSEPRDDEQRWSESRDDDRGRGGQRGPEDWAETDDVRRPGRRGDARALDAGESQGWDRHSGAPALPVGGVDQAALWGPPRQEPEPEPARRSRRQREDEEYGYPPVDEVPRAGGTRRSDYGYAEDDWR